MTNDKMTAEDLLEKILYQNHSHDESVADTEAYTTQATASLQAKVEELEQVADVRREQLGKALDLIDAIRPECQGSCSIDEAGDCECGAIETNRNIDLDLAAIESMQAKGGKQ